MNRYAYCDAEFNGSAVLCWVIITSDGQRFMLDTRSGGDGLRAVVAQLEGYIWVAFNCLAEMGAMHRLGVDFASLRWIDLMSESSMVTSTYPPHLSRSKGLIAALETFKVPRRADHDKKDMHAFILSQDTFSDDEFARILDYCLTDVEPMPALHGRIHTILKTVENYRGSWTTAHSLERGECVKAYAIHESRTRGLPVDVPWIEAIARNIEPIRNHVMERCNRYYGTDLFVRDPKTGEYTESRKNLEAYLAKVGYADWWERTDKGNLKTSEEYLDEVCKKVPALREYKRTRDMRKETKSFNLPNLVKDGFVRPGSVPFYTKTSRSQPFVKDGFILNMAPWLRSTIRPEPGWVIIAGDYSKQEIAIAAALTQDSDFIDAYTAVNPATGKADIYYSLANMAGAIQPGMSKDEIAIVRQAYKSVQLGLGYGMGLDALAAQLYAELNGGKQAELYSLEYCVAKADEIYSWHKRTFKTYWKWLNAQEAEARRVGLASSFDHWLYFASPDREITLRNQLINFPIQANGAMMLREAVKSLAWFSDLQVICTLHDAIYIYCREEEAEAAQAELRAHMLAAVEMVIGGRGVEIDVGFKVYTHETGYTDERATQVLAEIKAMVEGFEAAPPLPFRPRPLHTYRKGRPVKYTGPQWFTAEIVDRDSRGFMVAGVWDVLGIPVKGLVREVGYADEDELRAEVAFLTRSTPESIQVETI